MMLPRFPATRSSVPPGSPRRAALIRAAVALSAALVLLVLGLLDRDRSAPRTGTPTGDPVGGTLPGAPVATLPRLPTGASSPLAAGKLGVAAAAPGVEANSGAAGVQQAASASPAPSCPAPPPAAACPPPPASVAKADGVLLPRAAAAPAGSGYLVQLGVFAAPDNALRVYQQAATIGQAAHIQSRVVLGPFPDREAAERARKRLQAAGAGPGVLIPPERSR
ncbi:MAG: SPOR domain-containing protein [Thauera sp.]|nr:SPOR domain-containing protein [Thauera sp.]